MCHFRHSCCDFSNPCHYIPVVCTISESVRYSIRHKAMLTTGADKQTSEYIVSPGFSLADILFCKLKKMIETFRINKRITKFRIIAVHAFIQRILQRTANTVITKKRAVLIRKK